MNTKTFLLSKTFWVQVIALLAMASPTVRMWLDKNPEQFVAVFAAVNVLVRFVTSGRVNVFGNEDAGIGSGRFPTWILMTTAAALFVGALPSCSALPGLPVRASLELQDGKVSYSSKGGIQVEYSGK